MAVVTPQKYRYLTLNDTLTSGIVKVDPTLPICKLLGHHTKDGVRYRSILQVNSLKKQITADAALSFGEKLATFPTGFIRPRGGYVRMTSLCATGLSATAGEVGMGTVIGSGANATLGAVGATSEDLMEGTTLSNHVAATTLTSKKANDSVVFGTHGATGPGVLDGSGTAKSIYFNIASTFDQTASEYFTFSAYVVLDWEFVAIGTE